MQSPKAKGENLTSGKKWEAGGEELLLLNHENGKDYLSFSLPW